MIGASHRMEGYRNPRGTPAKGFVDPTVGRQYLKVSIGWTRPQLDAINRRVVRNNSTFAKEARRLLDIGLSQDHINDARTDWKEYNVKARTLIG